MTDGPTGIQVAPITEDEMTQVRSILQRAADAIVGASQMANDIAAMRAELDGLKADAERLRNQNNALDEALNHSRAVRDGLSQELAQTKGQLQQAVQERNNYEGMVNSLTTMNNSLQDSLKQAQDEANQWADEHDKVAKSLAEAHDKLSAIHEGYKSIFGSPPEAVQGSNLAQQQPGNLVQHPDAKPADDGPHYEDHPLPSEPAPAPPPPPVDEVDWNKPYHWNPVTGKYVND